NFILSELRLAADSGRGKGFEPVTVERAWCDHAAQQPALAAVLDGLPATGWNPWPRNAEPHTAFFQPEATLGPVRRLHIEMDFQDSRWPRHTLGRFRLAVTAQADPLARAEWRPLLTSPQREARTRL